MMDQVQRLNSANRVLKTFTRTTQLFLQRGRTRMSWEAYGETISREWACRGSQDFYPTLFDIWGEGGGTSITAISQLVRWVQGKACFSIESWEFWASERVNLIRDTETIGILRSAGYPKTNTCVICCEVITDSLDWWSLNGVSGPCHSYAMPKGCVSPI